MGSKSLVTATACVVLVPVLFALPAPQDFPSGRRGEDTGLPPIVLGQPRTLYEQFVDRLKLDANRQIPIVNQILADALKEAAPVGEAMLQLREQLVNLALANRSEDMKPVLDAYTAAAAKMAGIEVRAFAKVYATLKPNQQSNASQAFAIMAGMFQPSAPARGGARGGRGGGGR